MQSEGHEIKIEDDNGEVTKIKSLPLEEEKKFLGVFDCPAGGNAKQIEKIADKVNTWTNRMRNGHLPAYLGWKSYH